MEGQFETKRALRFDRRHTGRKRRRTRYAIEIPYGLSLLAFHDPQAKVKGLNDFPAPFGHLWLSSTWHFRSWSLRPCDDGDRALGVTGNEKTQPVMLESNGFCGRWFRVTARFHRD